jgi:GNAT superfamily N-acetyltransferase
MLQKNEWLSRQMGKCVYDFDASNPEVYESQIFPCENCLVVAKISSENIKLFNHLCSFGFKLVDTNIQFYRDFAPLEYSELGIRIAKTQDESSVAEVARTSFLYDRFHIDENIPPEISTKIKSEWAANYFRKLRGDLMIVAEVRGRIVGFLQMLETAENSVIIDLIAVRQDHRGLGLARNMIGYAIELYKNKHCLIVGTQLINSSSIALYQKIGFLYKSSQYVLHYHVKVQ